MKVEIFYNEDANFLSGYNEGNRLTLVDSLDVDFSGDVYEYLELVYRIYNVVGGNERPVELQIRSMSVGDVVKLDGVAYGVAQLGFFKVEASAP